LLDDKFGKNAAASRQESPGKNARAEQSHHRQQNKGSAFEN